MKTIKIAALTYDGEVYGTPKGSDMMRELRKIGDPLSIESWISLNMQQSNWWYLHGDLQAMVGFDKGTIINLDELQTIKTNNSETFDVLSIPDGIYDVEVFNIDELCIGYFWNEFDRLRGLVCLKRDIEGCEWAFNKFNEKSIVI